MPIKGTIFYNPSSGSKGGPTNQELEEAARAADLELVAVTPDLDIPALIRARIAQTQRLFIAAGGDGTINHVMQALVKTEAVLGVLPLGTYNHFAKDLGIPLDWKQALEIALRGATMQIDVGRVNERYFLNNICLGLYPEVVERREEKGRDYARWRAVPYAVYTAFRKFPHVSLNIESAHHFEAIRTHLFMVSNNPYELSQIGMEAPRPSLEQGCISVYWLPHMPKLQFIRVVARYFRGKVDGFAGFRSIRTTQLKVQSSHSMLRLGLDGELVRMAPPLNITTVPRSLLVKAPR